MSTSTDSLADLLGGRRGALDATVPPVAFALGWLLSGQVIGWGAGAAVVAAGAVAVWRTSRGEKVTAVLGGLAAVVVGALVALYTGRAEDFFLLQLLSNTASALAWALSTLVRWPFLGIVVGLLLRQRTRWRKDPDLLRAYCRTSWVWTATYVLRVVVFGLLWWSGQVVALTVARVALSWPLVALAVGISAWLVPRSLPADHPGFLHPRVPGEQRPEGGGPAAG
ncbi:DUF3159 domain-containing protein [Actinokineospora bangkokensis]|uniref:DUF3159 domain-containing protein n=1 Tax=Actinokineospora bangkokensis TaxID=1193682 RepID=UPI000A6BB86D|nr:DUF3159 domain-containing protein [Actinokineospora bangkokensis]